MLGELLAHTILGQYRVDAFVNRTPQGEFYRVIDLKHAKYLGMTVLPPGIDQAPETLKHLQARSAPLTRLTHPNLVPFLRLDQDLQATFLLESWVNGPSLQDVLQAHPGQPLNVTEALVYAQALCAALTHLNEQGFVHAGLSPERLHLDRDGHLRLSGVGACLRNGESTPLLGETHPDLYTAPEQTHPARLSPATDIYRLAALLFHLLTGHAPKDELTNPRSLNPDVPDFLARMLLKGLAKRPADRYESAAEFYLSLCMAARIPAESVPERLTPAAAPVSAEFLTAWHYLPPAESVSAPIHLRPLEKQVTSAGVAPRNGFQWERLIRPALGTLVLGALAFVLWQIQPTPTQPVELTQAPSASPVLPSPAPTFTLPPEPTQEHGGRIIFTCTRGDYNQLCMIRADGTGYQLLTNTTANNYYPTFAPGGGMIVFASNRFGAFDLFLLILQSGNLSQLTDHVGNVLSPDFSPDGYKIVFANRAAEGPTSIWVTNRDGSNSRLLYAGPNTIVSTAWSPDGNTIAFAMSVDQPNEYQIFLMNIDGTNIRQVSKGLLGIGGSLDWSPDGQNLLVFAGPPADKDIFSLDVATGTATQLTDGGNNTASCYSPDGQWIVFNSLRNNDQADLYIMRADGTELRQLTDNPEPDWQPHWEP